MKLLLSIYDQCVVMHMKFSQDILSTRGVIGDNEKYLIISTGISIRYQICLLDLQCFL